MTGWSFLSDVHLTRAEGQPLTFWQWCALNPGGEMEDYLRSEWLDLLHSWLTTSVLYRDFSEDAPGPEPPGKEIVMELDHGRTQA